MIKEWFIYLGFLGYFPQGDDHKEGINIEDDKQQWTYSMSKKSYPIFKV